MSIDIIECQLVNRLALAIINWS